MVNDEQLAKRLDRIDDDISDVRRRMSILETQDAVASVHRENVERRLGGIEDTLKWVVRLIIGGIVTALLAVVLTSGGVPIP